MKTTMIITVITRMIMMSTTTTTKTTITTTALTTSREGCGMIGEVNGGLVRKGVGNIAWHLKSSAPNVVIPFSVLHTVS